MSYPTREIATKAGCAYSGCSRVIQQTHLCKQHLSEVLGLEIKPSHIIGAGNGLFAHKDRSFMCGDRICTYEGELIIAPPQSNVCGDYVLQLDDKTFIDARATTSCPGRYSNTCRRTNKPRKNNAQLEHDPVTGISWVVATKEICGGDEIYTNYNTDSFFD